MRFFYIALIILAVTLSIMIANCIYIKNVSNHLIDAVRSAERLNVHDAIDTVNKIYDYWESQRGKVSLSVSYIEIDRVDDYIVMLKTAADNKNEYEYQNALNLLRDAAEEIARLEKFEFYNIF